MHASFLNDTKEGRNPKVIGATNRRMRRSSVSSAGAQMEYATSPSLTFPPSCMLRAILSTFQPNPISRIDIHLFHHHDIIIAAQLLDGDILANLLLRNDLLIEHICCTPLELVTPLLPLPLIRRDVVSE